MKLLFCYGLLSLTHLKAKLMGGGSLRLVYGTGIPYFLSSTTIVYMLLKVLGLDPCFIHFKSSTGLRKSFFNKQLTL